jgi:histone-lysine N-methyltransferase SETMAR
MKKVDRIDALPLTIDQLHEKFPQFSRSSLHKILSKHLGYKKICARWVPWMLSDNHRKNCTDTTLTFLEHYHQDRDKFLNHIVTVDEIWVSHFTPEIKHQLLEWHHP